MLPAQVVPSLAINFSLYESMKLWLLSKHMSGSSSSSPQLHVAQAPSSRAAGTASAYGRGGAHDGGSLEDDEAGEGVPCSLMAPQPSLSAGGESTPPAVARPGGPGEPQLRPAAAAAWNPTAAPDGTASSSSSSSSGGGSARPSFWWGRTSLVATADEAGPSHAAAHAGPLQRPGSVCAAGMCVLDEPDQPLCGDEPPQMRGAPRAERLHTAASLLAQRGAPALFYATTAAGGGDASTGSQTDGSSASASAGASASGTARQGGGSAAGLTMTPTMVASLSCGCVSGFIASTITFPLDVVRRRMQVRSVRHSA